MSVSDDDQAEPLDASPNITLSEPLGQSLSIFHGSGMQLVAAFGRLENSFEDTVLVPFVDFQFDYSNLFDGENKKSMSFSVPAENIAFLLSDMSEEFLNVCVTLEAISSGRLKPEAKRLNFLIESLETAYANIQKAAALVRQIQSV